MTKKKFSKDPKVKLVSMKEFLMITDYFSNDKGQFWIEGNRPDCGIYYDITPRLFIMINYTLTTTNFGMDFSEKLDYIIVAYRNGKIEYELFAARMKELLKEKEEHKSKCINAIIDNLKYCIRYIKNVKYLEQTSIKNRDFEEYITDVEYKTNFEQLKEQYVVFDVETNGIRKLNDDLLSISIYDPTSGKCYNRYLPLELQPIVLTGWINGITDSTLENASHLTQDEVNKLIEYFDLKNRTLLSFSGGKGTFDSSFIINYCKRHNLVGFENLKYENIKSMFPNVGFGLEGQLSKDNLCRLLKIDGVQNIHSSMTDCLLEWKLFEKIKTEPLFFIKQHMFKYHKGYIVPVSYMNSHPELAAFANITVPYIVGKAKKIFEISLPKKVVRKVKKFPTNITGLTLENAINSALNVKKQDNYEFLVKNKSYLEYIGSLDSRITEIPVEAQEDGTIKSMNPQYDKYIDRVNKVTKIITENITSVFDFIKKEIFSTGKIMSQELSISPDGKVLALCDLSDEYNVLEIKTFSISKADESIDNNLARQLYYESNGRNTYVLSIDIDEHKNNKCESITDAVNIRIYQVLLKKSEPKQIERVKILADYEIEILEMINVNPSVSNASIAKSLCFSPNMVGKIVKGLVNFKYIKKEDETKKRSRWILLRSLDDSKTKYIYNNGEKIPIVDHTKNL